MWSLPLHRRRENKNFEKQTKKKQEEKVGCYYFLSTKKAVVMELISDEDYEKRFLGLFSVCLASFSDPITQR